MVWVLLAMGTAAAQAPSPDLDATFEVNGRAVLQGELDLTADLAGILLTPGPDSQFEAELDEARITVVNAPYRISGTSPGSPTGRHWVTVAEETHVVWSGPFAGRIHLDRVGGTESMIRILPLDSALTVALSPEKVELGPVTIGSAAAPTSHNQLAAFRVSEFDGHPLVASGPFAPTSVTTSAVEGPALLVVYAGSLRLDGPSGSREIATGHALNTSQSQADPLGYAGSWKYDRIAVVVEAGGGTIHMSAGGGDVSLLAKTVTGRVVGDIAFHGVNGALSVAGEDASGAFALAQAIGNFSVQARYGARSTWSVGGAAEFVALDAEAVFGTRPTIGVHPAVVAGVVSMVLVVLLALAALLRRSASLVTLEVARLKALVGAMGVVAARIRRARVLDSPARRAIAEFVRKRPWATRSEIAHRANLNRQTVRYHLDILVRKGVLITRKTGRWPRYHRALVDGIAAISPLPSRDHEALQAVLSMVEGGPVRKTDACKLMMGQYGFARSSAWAKLDEWRREARLDESVRGRAKWLTLPGTRRSSVTEGGRSMVAIHADSSGVEDHVSASVASAQSL